MAFISQRVCSIEAIVAAAREQIHPHLSYLLGLIDLLGRTGRYVPSWVHEFYATLWIDPAHRFIHFAFRGRDYRLMSFRVREILRLKEQPVWLHEVCYGQTAPPRRPHDGMVPPTDLVHHCFIEPFGEGSSKTPSDLTPIARVLDAIMRRTLVGVLDRGVLNQPVNVNCVPLIPDGDAKRHKVYTGSGNRCPMSSLGD